MPLALRPPTVCSICLDDVEPEPGCPYCEILRETALLLPSYESVSDLKAYLRGRRSERGALLRGLRSKESLPSPTRPPRDAPPSALAPPVVPVVMVIGRALASDSSEGVLWIG